MESLRWLLEVRIPYEVVVISIVGMIAVCAAFSGRSQKTQKGGADPLDDVLFQWADKSLFRLRHLLQSVAGFGATGSGKTSSVAKCFAEAIVRHPRSSMLVLAAKPDDVRQWQRYFAQRKQDLLVFEPEGALRFNVLDYLLKSGGDCRDVTRYLTISSETLRTGNGSGRDEGAFWEQQQERGIYNATVMLKLATGGVSAPDLQRFLTGAAMTPVDLASEAWREGYHNHIIRRAVAAKKSPEEKADFEIAKDYFIHELPTMADKTRSSIFTGIFGLLHYLNTSSVHTLLSGETNTTPEDMLVRGKTILVNAAPARYGNSGKLINAAWKFATQWAVLRRDAKPTDYFNIAFVDEAQLFVNGMDAEYLAQSRSHLGCMIYFSQSRHSYYAALGGEAEKEKADALLANFNLKIFNALGDVETAQWASDLCGRELRTFFGGSVAPSEGGLWDEMTKEPKVTSSFSTQFSPRLEPSVFMHKLRTGSAVNGYIVDAVIVKTGEPFANGQNWMWTSFSQR